MLERGSRPCSCHERTHQPRLIAVTGGPGAGKTAVLQLARRSFCKHVALLPEAATIIFGGGFPRHVTHAARMAAQRAIFYVQRECERLVVDEHEVAVGLCDRGTIDGAAYWPGRPEELFDHVGTTLDRELARYALVIHLETPAEEHGYNHVNPLRVESAEEAREIDARIAAMWAAHPRRFVIPSAPDFSAKAIRALEILAEEIPVCCRA